MTLKAIIPVRSGSTRVKNKNIRPFCGTTLLEIKINQLKRISRIDDVIVNSNSDEMLEIAKSLGATPVKRDDYFASNTVSINEVYKNQAENCDSDYIMHCTVTNPLIEDKTIEEIIDKFFEVKDEYHSINSSHNIKEFMWLNGKSINYDASKMPRSQDLPPIMGLNFAVNILSREQMIESRNVVSDKPYLFPISDIEATDIDWEIDFEFAEFMYKKYRMGV